MGEMADYYAESEIIDLADWEFVPRIIQCTRCGAEDLYWVEASGGLYRLMDSTTGNIHECDMYNLAQNVFEEIK